MREIEQLDFPVSVKRTGRRKTVAIRIVDGIVHVTVPMRLSESRILDLLRQKDRWIRRKLSEDGEKPKMRPRQFAHGESFLYLGSDHRLKLMEGARGKIRLRGDCLELSVPERLTGEAEKRYVRNQLALWYRDRASELLDAKTARFSGLMGVTPNHVEVKYFKSRWGSCSTEGTIKYNWRIIMAPQRIVDYLVVHELAHLVHHNHSPLYWKFVGSCLPDFHELRGWLKQNGPLLSLDVTPA